MVLMLLLAILAAVHCLRVLFWPPPSDGYIRQRGQCKSLSRAMSRIERREKQIENPNGEHLRILRFDGTIAYPSGWSLAGSES
jgi:hypothetical protein